ncbi:hypothetical protein PINS_up009959 [Pythium insidiosum]|nr:hypothetical protein PINS_up009959 [Pythium insidiosum]
MHVSISAELQMSLFTLEDVCAMGMSSGIAALNAKLLAAASRNRDAAAVHHERLTEAQGTADTPRMLANGDVCIFDGTCATAPDGSTERWGAYRSAARHCVYYRSVNDGIIRDDPPCARFLVAVQELERLRHDTETKGDRVEIELFDSALGTFIAVPNSPQASYTLIDSSGTSHVLPLPHIEPVVAPMSSDASISPAMDAINLTPEERCHDGTFWSHTHFSFRVVSR